MKRKAKLSAKIVQTPNLQLGKIQFGCRGDNGFLAGQQIEIVIGQNAPVVVRLNIDSLCKAIGLDRETEVIDSPDG